MPRFTFPRACAIVTLGSALISRGIAGQDKATAVPNARPSAATLAAKAAYRLEFDHVTGRLALYTHRGQLIAQNETLGIIEPVRIPPDRPLELVVVNANSLLYQYSATSRALAGRRVRACQDVGSQFTSSGFAIGISAVTGGSALPTFNAVVKEWPDVPTLKSESRFTAVTQEELLDALRRTSTAAGAFTALTQRMEDFASTANDSLGYIAELAESTPIDTLLARFRRSFSALHPDLGEGALVPRAVINEYRKVVPTAAELSAMVDAVPVIANGPADSPVNSAQRLLRDIEVSLVRARRAGREMQRVLARIEAARVASRRVFFLEPAGVPREIALILSATPGAVSDSLVRLRQGSVTLYTAPVSRMLCNVEAGFTVMTPPPDFIVEEKSGVVLDRSEGSSMRSSVALMFDVAPGAFDVLGAIAGLGLSANGGAPDLYLGGSMRAFAPFHLTFGSVWQRKQRLPAGAEVGEVAPSRAEFSALKRRYGAGFFVGVMLGR
jgi:hypothetical protein